MSEYSQSELRTIGHRYLARALQRVTDYDTVTTTEIASIGMLAALLGIAEDLSRMAGIKNMTMLIQEER